MVWYTHVVASIRHVKQGVGEVDKADENDFILPDELKRKAFFLDVMWTSIRSRQGLEQANLFY